MKRMLATLFYMMISILGLTFLGLIGVVAVHLAMGKATPGDLRNMLRVLGGESRYVTSKPDYDRYQAFLADEDKMRADARELYGSDRQRLTSQALANATRQELADALASATAELDMEKQRVLDVRAQVESLKTQLAVEQKKLSDERARKASVEADDATKKLRATLAGRDEGQLANYLTDVAQQSGPEEAARIMREHLAADLNAAILDAITVPDVERKIVPLLENKYAGVPPARVVDMFQTANMRGPEMAVYLKQMSAAQALGTYLRLSEREREELAPLLLSSK